jgi:hypothetical protein
MLDWKGYVENNEVLISNMRTALAGVTKEKS